MGFCLSRKYPEVSTTIPVKYRASNYSRYVITSGAPDHPAEYDEPNGGTPNERCKYNTICTPCRPSML